MMSSSLVGWAFGLHLYTIFMTALVVGIILFIIWAARLETKKLRQWVIWLLAIGIIGCLLTFQYGWSFFGGINNMMGGGRAGMMGRGIPGNTMMNFNQNE